MMEAQTIFDTLKEQFGDAVIELQQPEIEPIIRIAPESLMEIAEFVKSNADFQCDYMMCLTGVDLPPPPPPKPKKKKKTDDEDAPVEEAPPAEPEPEPIYECAVLYHLYSMTHRHRVTLKVQMPREDAHVASVTALWQAADWHEREAYDLIGVVFDGHPNLTRILLPDDWEGHPLQKDYKQQEYYDIEGTPVQVPRGW
jgi:NADH-quinone oxidoreductase subunit C